jgi:hypothetical protein
MGAWGVNAFDNDTACDWASELEGAEGLSAVAASLDAVLDTGEDYLDSGEACAALAACEVIARLNGNWGVRNGYTEAVDHWVESHPQKPPPNLVRKAVAAIERVLGESSELPDLWKESPEYADWQRAVENLRMRVQT